MQLRERRRGDAQAMSEPAAAVVVAANARSTCARRAVPAAVSPLWPGSHAVLPLAHAQAGAAGLTPCTPAAHRGTSARAHTPATTALQLAGPAALSLPKDAYASYLSFPSALSDGFPSADDEGPRLPTPEHCALLRTLSDEDQSTPTRLFADPALADAQASMSSEPLPGMENAPDWNHLLLGAPPAAPAVTEPLPCPPGAGAPGDAACADGHDNDGAGGSGDGSAHTDGTRSNTGRARRQRNATIPTARGSRATGRRGATIPATSSPRATTKRGATSPGARGPRRAAAAPGSRKGLGNKPKKERLEFERPDVQDYLRYLTGELRLSLEKIRPLLAQRFGRGLYSRFHLSKVCKEYGIPTAHGRN